MEEQMKSPFGKQQDIEEKGETPTAE